MPFPRITTRRWMFAVAAVGLLIAVEVTLCRRAAWFHELADRHESKANVVRMVRHSKLGPAEEVSVTPFGGVPLDPKLVDWHLQLRDKYKRAAYRPWLPVPPDPPPPK